MQWRKGPRPDPSVIELIEQYLVAARKGQIRAIAITAVNPMLETETNAAGDLDHVKTHLLSAGLVRASNKLLNGLPPE